jgi:hypothetical protein
MSSEHAQRIMETVTELNKLLDVEQPFTWIVHDPSGTSEFKPDDGVAVLTGRRRRLHGCCACGAVAPCTYGSGCLEQQAGGAGRGGA